jgi:hypothetical protein
MRSPLYTSPGLSDLLPLVDCRPTELEIFLLHAVIVAGKNAPFANNALKRFIGEWERSPFALIRSHIQRGVLDDCIKQARLGNYNKMGTCFRRLVSSKLDLETCGIDELEAIPYIGCKTSRYFLMYTRPVHQTNRIAVIDTHTWKWVKSDPWAKQRLLEMGVETIPDKPPSDRKRYRLFEEVVVADAHRKGISTRNWDIANWNKESRFSDLARERAMTTINN